MRVESEPSLLRQMRALPAAGPLPVALWEADNVYLVGGTVRDLMLQGEPPDFDFVVEGDLETVIGALGVPSAAYDRFGTATVRLDGHRYDFARARRETYSAPGALPDVEPAGIEEDLKRRDFTVNAMALGLGGPRAGSLLSVDAAREDLKRRQLRVLHDASFVDDPTRTLRLARYAGRLSFQVEPHTLQLLGAALAGGALRTVSGTRVGSELRLLAGEADPLGGFAALRRLGLDRALAPAFGLADPELARRALKLLPPDGDRAALVLAAACLGIDAAQLPRFLDGLAFEAGDRDTIVAAATEAEPMAAALESARRPSEIATAVGERARPELVALAGAMGPADKARRWLDDLRDVRLEIDGTDLLAAGVPAGPAVGVGLRAAWSAKLDGRVKGREAELAEALRAATGQRIA
jgi:tRNA nucleotidyltransferase (CCA-adding enzyme)